MDINFEFQEPYEYKKISPIEKEMEPICPTCIGQLKEVPKRKTKCPHCGNAIYLKYSPSNPVKRLVNEKENEQIQIEWEEYQQKQSLLQNLDKHGIKANDLQGVELSDDDAVYKKSIEVFIKKQEKYKRICELYFELAIDVYPKIKELQNDFDELSEEDQEDLSEDEYFSYYPFGFIHENYWEAILSYIKVLIREVEQIKRYGKAGIEYFEIRILPDHNSSPIDLSLNNSKILVKDGLEFVNKLLLIASKDELIKLRPLYFFNEVSQTKILFPPFRLGCTASSVMAY